MKALILVIGLIVAITAGLFLWSRTRSRVVTYEITLSSGTATSRTLEIGLDVPEAELRDVLLDQITRQLPEKPPRVRSEVLRATVFVRVEREPTSELVPLALIYDPGPPEGWHPALGSAVENSPMSREQALDTLLKLLLQQFEMNRRLYDP